MRLETLSSETVADVLIGNLLDTMRTAGLLVETQMAEAGNPLGQIDIIDVVHDSRAAAPGSLFCAVPGATVDGHDFIDAASAGGASALLVERFVAAPLAQLRVESVRAAMPTAAACVHGNPSQELAVVGITGTNGKTTTTHMLASIMQSAGRTVDVIGTLSGRHTTPEAPEFQRHLRSAVDAGVDVVAAEISSHALDQHRADAIHFAVTAFSNLTPDHLDYHGDMERYFEAKRRLFDGRSTHEVINVDDSWGAKLAELRPDAHRISLNDITTETADLHGTTFVWRGHRVHLSIPGAMNVANAVMAAEIAVLLGASIEQVATGLSAVPQVPGRMERVTEPNAPVTVLVDYSHTPDSIERALAAIRMSDPSALVTIVFGCGGDRDRSKRPLMAQAAEAGADIVILTSDNPRSEDPDVIIADARNGMVRPDEAIVESDRRRAIAVGLDRTPDGGVLLIAGKGHERTQTIGDQILPFDDVTIASELLEERDR